MTTDGAPLVTIAIPTFNRAGSFLGRALNGACRQTYANLDIFVCDNASTDGTRELVSAIGDERIRYHRQDSNIGSPANMNFCVQQARGQFLVVLPDDDELDLDFVELCVDRMRRGPTVGLVRTGVRVVDEHGQVKRETPNEATGVSFDDYLVDWIKGRASPYQCSTFFRTELLQEVGLKSRHFLFDDVMAHFEISAKHGGANIRDIKASFRLHSGELTAKADIVEWCEESMDLLQLMYRLSPGNAELIRTEGLRFLAVGNYRRALRLPALAPVLGCLTVLRTHGFALPPRAMMTGAVRRKLSTLPARLRGR